MYDMDEELFERKREIEQMELQIAECQREIRRLHNVCRSYEEGREIRKEWKFFSLKDILKRLGAEEPYRTTESDINLFTEDGAKAFEDLKKILYAIEKIVGTDMNVLVAEALLDAMVTKSESDMELYQLHILLQIFDMHGRKGRYTVGDWAIVNGGYDVWFEIYYKKNVKLQCISGEVRVFSATKCSREAILNCILEEYDNLCEGEE